MGASMRLAKPTPYQLSSKPVDDIEYYCSPAIMLARYQITHYRSTITCSQWREGTDLPSDTWAAGGGVVQPGPLAPFLQASIRTL